MCITFENSTWSNNICQLSAESSVNSLNSAQIDVRCSCSRLMPTTLINDVDHKFNKISASTLRATSLENNAIFWLLIAMTVLTAVGVIWGKLRDDRQETDRELVKVRPFRDGNAESDGLQIVGKNQLNETGDLTSRSQHKRNSSVTPINTQGFALGQGQPDTDRGRKTVKYYTFLNFKKLKKLLLFLNFHFLINLFICILHIIIKSI